MRSKQNCRATAYHPLKPSATRAKKQPHIRRSTIVTPFLSGKFHFRPTSVVIPRQPNSDSTATSWITAATRTDSRTVHFQHPLTLSPLLCNLPENLVLPHFNYPPIAVSYHTSSPYFNKLLVLDNRKLWAIFNGGELLSCTSYDIGKKDASWTKLMNGEFDDIIIRWGQAIYALDRRGNVYDVTMTKSTSERSANITIYSPFNINPGPVFIGWRKRLVKGTFMYLVVRTAEKSFRVIV